MKKNIYLSIQPCFVKLNAIRRALQYLPIAALVLAVNTANATEVNELIRHIDQLWRGTTSKTTLAMTVKTRRYQRTMLMDAWSHGKHYSLVVIRSPVKDRGIATLKVEDNIWNYLPKINRVTKVPSSMMAGSWMGSHFTNDDLVKESTFEDDYNSTITFEGQKGTQNMIEITSTPKPNAPVVWGKVVMMIDKETLTPTASLYYDEENKLIRTIEFSHLKTINGKQIPMELKLTPEEKPDETTTILYQDMEFDVPIDTDFFSLQNLQKRR